MTEPTGTVRYHVVVVPCIDPAFVHTRSTRSEAIEVVARARAADPHAQILVFCGEKLELEEAPGETVFRIANSA